MRLNCLGGFELRNRAGERIDIPAKKTKALLAFLALADGRPESRDKLAALLWEDAAAAQGRHSLRQALADLRKALGTDLLQTAADAVTVTPGTLTMDAEEFQRAARCTDQDDLEHAVELYRGEFLEGLAIPGEAFEDWLMAQREQLRELARSAMAQLLDRYRQRREPRRAIELARRLLGLDPLQESVHRDLMALYLEQRQFSAALKQYRSCAAVLAAELGVEPEPATRDLQQRIKQVRQHVAPEATRREAPAETGSGDEVSPPELRHIVVLCATLPDEAGGDPESRHERMLRLRETAAGATARHRGEIIQQLEGAVLVAFGLTATRSTDSQHALGAARDLVENLPLGVGLASGPVIIGAEGPPTGEVLAEVRSLATRAGPGGILLARALHDALAPTVESEPVAEPAGAFRFRALRRDPATAAATELVGRQGECRLFVSALESCRETGGGQSFLLRGEAGIGKTRLVEEFTDLARSRGFAAHKVWLLDFGGGDPLAELITSLLQTQAQEPRARMDILQRALDEAWVSAEREYWLRDLLGLLTTAQRHALFGTLDNAARERGYAELVTELLVSLSTRQPQLLVFEDLHWGGPDLLALLARLAEAVMSCTVLLLMTTRVEGEPLDPAWRGAMAGASLTTLDLGPLRAPESLALAQLIAPVPPPGLAELVRRAGGNPLFLEQLLRAAGGASARLPDTVQSIVSMRLDGLAPADRAAVQAAAVLGQRFQPEALAHLLAVETVDCTDLLARRLIRKEGSDLVFCHALIAEGAYLTLLRSRRQALHRLAADWHRQRDRVRYAEHLDRAGDAAPAAVAYAEAAAEQLEQYRLERALPLLQRARELHPDAPERMSLACRAGEVLRELGRTEESIAVFQGILQDTAAPTDARAWLGLAAGLSVCDRRDEALDALARAQAAAAASGDSAALARTHYQRGNVYFPTGRLEECLQEHTRALDYARQSGSHVLQARALSGLGDAHYLRGRMARAGQHFQACVDLCRQHRLMGIESVNLMMLGVTRYYHNDLDGAAADVEGALAIAARTGNKRDESLARNVLGLLATTRAQWHEALQQSQRSIELARAVGSLRFVAEETGNVALAQAQLGNYPLAERLIAEAYELSLRSGPGYSGAWNLGIWALVARDRQRRDWALAEGEKLLQQDAVSHSYLHFCEFAMEACIELEDTARLRHYADLLAAYTRDEPLPRMDYVIERGRVLAALLDGDQDLELARRLDGLIRATLQVGCRFALPALEQAYLRLAPALAEELP